MIAFQRRVRRTMPGAEPSVGGFLGYLALIVLILGSMVFVASTKGSREYEDVRMALSRLLQVESASVEQLPDEKLQTLTWQASLNALEQIVTEKFPAHIHHKTIQFSGLGESPSIQLADTILFSPGAADISLEGEVILVEFAEQLAKTDGLIEVNRMLNERLNGLPSPQHWELSARQAAAVVTALQRNGIASHRFVAVTSVPNSQYYFLADTGINSAKVSIVIAGLVASGTR